MDNEEHHRLSEKEAAAAATTTTTSPSHEFSFTISLHPSPNSNPTTIKRSKNIVNPTFAIDLAPADDIFFHGHLLPLHLLSNTTSISPRPSDFSIENLSLPLAEDQSQNYENNNDMMMINEGNNHTNKEKFNKTKNFSSSLFGLGKWLVKVGDQSGKKKKKMMLDLSRVFKRYMEPLFSFKGGDKEKRRLAPRPYTFSGNIGVKDKEMWRKRRGELSAPASMRTSPTNSGLLVATSAAFSSSDESTMEELQNAIQAAISHCKNSISMSSEDPKCIC